MGGTGRRIRPMTALDLEHLPDQLEINTEDRMAAIETVTRWGFCGVVFKSVDEPIGGLLISVMPGDERDGSAAALLRGAYLIPAERGHGLGRELIQAVAVELIRRDVTTIEAVGRPRALPTGFLRAVGFRVVQSHPISPRLRLDLTTTVRRRPDLAAAWHRLAGLVPTTIAPPQPAGFEKRRGPVVGQRYSSIAPSSTDLDFAPLNAFTSSPPT